MSLTAVERALRRILIERARANQLITYAEVAGRLSPYSPVRLEKPWSPLYRWLGHVFRFELQADRPPLTSIVVQADRSGPGEGFFTCARSLGDLVDGMDPNEYWRNCRVLTFAFWHSTELPEADRLSGWEPDSHTVELADGRTLRVQAWPDNRLRLYVDDAPYAITSAHLTRSTKGRAFLSLEPLRL